MRRKQRARKLLSFNRFNQKEIHYHKKAFSVFRKGFFDAMKHSGNISFLVLFSIFALLSACSDKDTVAEITIKDGTNNPLQGIQVVLVGDINHDPANDPPLNIADTATTNSEGKVVFNFTDKIKPGQSGFVVVDVVLSDQDNIILDKMILYQEERNSETFYFTP